MKFIKFVLFLLLLIPVAALLILYMLVPAQVNKVTDTHLTDAEFSMLVKDLRHIAEMGVYPLAGQERDAGDALNSYIGTTSTPADTVAWWGEEDVSTAINDAEKGWSSAPREMPEGDLSLLKELMAYDHWEASSSGAYGRSVAGLDMPLSMDGPIPNYSKVTSLVKLRLAKGLATGQMKPALEEVRHLAQLVYSDENMMAVLVSRSILDAERQAYDTAVERGLIRAGDWTPVTEEDKRIMDRAWNGVSLVMRGGAGSDGYHLLGELGVPIYGLCGAANEAMMDVMVRKAILADPMPFEPRFDKFDGPVEAAIADTRCRLPEARKSIGEGFDATALQDTFFPKDSKERELLRPYSRTMVYAILMGVASPANPYR